MLPSALPEDKNYHIVLNVELRIGSEKEVGVLEEHTDGDGGSGGAERRCKVEPLEWSLRVSASDLAPRLTSRRRLAGWMILYEIDGCRHCLQNI